MGTHCIEHWTRARHPEKAYSLFDVRADDSATSKDGSQAVKIRKDSQQYVLLQTYANPAHWTHGLTDEEAGERSGLAAKPRCCYWKRCSELRELGLLEDTGIVRPSSAGCDQRAFRITMLGMSVAARLS